MDLTFNLLKNLWIESKKMQKILYLQIYCILLLMSCSKKGPDSQQIVNDTISQELIQQAETTQSSILNEAQSKILSEKSLLNLEQPVPLPKKWLQNAASFKNDTLPDSLAEFFGEFLCEYPVCYHIQSANLDEDEEQEKILFLYYGCGVAAFGLTFFLDQAQEQTLITAISRHVSRSSFDEMKPEHTSIGQMIICKSGGWGSGYHDLMNYYYKFIEGNWEEILRHQTYSFWAFPMVTFVNKTTSTIHSEKHLSITFTYNYFQQRFEPDEIIYLLKNKKNTVHLYWNEAEKRFKANLPKEEALLTATDAHTFPSFYIKELRHINQYGTTKQKEVLKQYNLSGESIVFISNK